MDPSACRVIYIDGRFNAERWISREGASPVTTQKLSVHGDLEELPIDLQANVGAFLSVFNQVYVCRSGRAFSSKLSELHETVKSDCTPIIACFDVGSESKHNHISRTRPRFAPGADSPLPSPTVLRRELTFSSESDESYGLQLLSRIAADLQVDEGVKLIIPVAVVQPKRKDSYDQALSQSEAASIARSSYGSDVTPLTADDQSDIVDPQMMLQCLDAGALDVVRGPLDKAGIMGLTVHAYRIYKSAKNAQKGFMASARQNRKQSWVGFEEEKPYSYLREAMVKKLLKGICEPQNVIEDYQHRDLFVQESRKVTIAEEVGKWSFCGHDFTEDELVYAGYAILNHALNMPDLENWRIPQDDLLKFMQGCQVAYNSFVLYHNFRHAVDVLQSVFYFLLQIGILPPYPNGADPAPFANDKSPVAKLLGPFEALTLLISAIGHDVGHPGVNNMFLVKLNAPLAQLYNDQSVLEAFHCAAYSQILRRHWPVVFNDKGMRKLMISSILATDMGIHADYIQQLGNLQSKVHESKTTDGWQPKDVDANRVLACGLLIKCADISNVARPWSVAEKWTHLLQKEFAHQGEMEAAVGMETTLFGGPPELGNMLKLANGQIGFMGIFAHPLFANVADIIPAMGFAANEILTNKAVWFSRAEQEKKKKHFLLKDKVLRDGGTVSPRSQSPVRKKGDDRNSYFPSSPLRARRDSPGQDNEEVRDSQGKDKSGTPRDGSSSSSLAAVAGIYTSNAQADHAKSSDGLRTPRQNSADRSTSTPANQTLSTETDKSSATAAEPGVATDMQTGHAVTPGNELSDTRKDNGVSMRAGSNAVPVMNGDKIETVGIETPAVETTQSELSKFTFATSEPDEPVRQYDPQQDYFPEHPEARASAPTNDLEHEQQKEEMREKSRHTTSAQSDTNTIGTSLRGGGHEDALTPSHSTTATSYTSEKSAPSSPTPRSTNFSRNRTISGPPSASVLSKSTSCEGNKTDIRTTVLTNGDIAEGRGDRSNYDRKTSVKTLDHRSSRIKLKNLAFWKRRDKNSYNGDEPETNVN